MGYRTRMRYVELRRHTDNDGDVLTPDGADLEAMRDVDPDLVEQESVLLGSALRDVIDGLPEGARALVIGHGPTNEAAVLGLTSQVVAPLDKGGGVLVTESGGTYDVARLD